MSRHRHSNFSRLGLISCLAIALIGALTIAPAAFGQAAVDQYIDLGPLGEFAEGDTGNEGAGAGQGAGDGDGAAGGQGSAAGGTLPFTGYPLTPLILLLLAMIATGVAIRLGLSAKDRLEMARISSAGKRYR